MSKPRKYTRQFLRSQLRMYVETAVEIAMEKQAAGTLHRFGVFPTILTEAVEEISGRTGQVLVWRCDQCEEEGCECYNCRECDEHQDDCECEEE